MRVSLLICAVLLTSAQFARSSPLEIIENNEVPVAGSEDELNSSANSDVVGYQEHPSADEILDDNYEEYVDEPEVDPELSERTIGIESPICDKYADLKYPLHLSHHSDCRKFYKCSNGRGILFDCPSGEEWSVKLDRCEYADMAGCRLDGSHQYKLRKVSVRASSDSVPFMDLSEDKINKVHTILDDEDYMIADARCEVDVKDKNRPTHFAHPTNCQMFYKCFNNFAYKTSCPDVLHYNAKTQACDYPAIAKCRAPVSVQAASMRVQMPSIPDCRHGRNVNYGMQGSLTKYFECRSGEVYLMECGNNEFFNPNTMQCDPLYENLFRWQSYDPKPYRT